MREDSCVVPAQVARTWLQIGHMAADSYIYVLGHAHSPITLLRLHAHDTQTTSTSTRLVIIAKVFLHEIFVCIKRNGSRVHDSCMRAYEEPRVRKSRVLGRAARYEEPRVRKSRVLGRAAC